MRKMLVNNYAYIVPPPGSRTFENSPSSSYRSLGEQIKELASLPQDVKEKFVDVITLAPDVEAFRDFDVPAFLNHFGLDALQKCVLAVGFKPNTRADLRNKGRECVSLQDLWHANSSYLKARTLSTNPFGRCWRYSRTL